ncbi:unnamed protein product [Mytilus edulis]|uniref:Ketoreductase domain-containing protein n=1 Tax=Mytilus edulis TaxID=6550 RepID=A0A8S3UIM7_MYTED|nr:unnamed protein product [Mytilus edulis]
MSPEDIFNTVKTSCVILTKLCQKLIHEKVDVVMYVLTKQTQPKVSLQDNGHVNILGSELWGMVRCLMREEVFTKLFLIDFEEESDLICLQEVMNNEHNEQLLPSELKFEKQCIYSSTLMRSTIDEPTFRMNTYNANDALELKSEKYNKITRPFFRHTHLSKVYEGSVELEVMSSYTDQLWFPASLTEIVGGDDPWKLYCTNGHQLLSAETCGKAIHRSTTDLKSLEKPHRVQLHEEYVTCYPVNASNFVVVPEDCILEKIRFPNYQPGILLQIAMFFSIADEISKLNPIAILYDETVATIHVVHLLECILEYTVGILQKIPIACGNGRTFSFDTKDKDDIKDTVRRLDVASTRNDLFGKHSSVFQGAAVLDDGTILNMTELKLDKVLRPKVLGTWNLHMVTKDMDLDYFVLHSSTASAFGNVGQLNYGAGNSFMDAVSFYRQNTGLSGQTINWGPLQLGLMKVKDGLEQFLTLKATIH